MRWKSKVESRELRVEIYIYIYFLTEKHLKEFKQIRADFEHSEALGLAALLRSLRCHGLTFAKLDFWRLCGGSNAQEMHEENCRVTNKFGEDQSKAI